MFIPTQGASAPTLFRFDESLTLRAFARAGAVWFVAADVAQALGYRDATQLTRRLKDDEKATQPLRTPAGAQRLRVLSESGLVHALRDSRHPAAPALHRWVTGTVLPSFRHHGPVAAAEPLQARLPPLPNVSHALVVLDPVAPAWGGRAYRLVFDSAGSFCTLQPERPWWERLADPDDPSLMQVETGRLFDLAERVQGAIRARCLAPEAG